MVYAKKLIVLTGAGGKGTVTLERSASGLECRLTTYNLPDLTAGRYVLAFLGERTQAFELGRVGRMNIRVRLEDMRIDNIHIAVAAVGADIAVRLYGTNAPAALWEGNMVDRIRRHMKADEPAREPVRTAGLPAYSSRPVEDFFFDIFPTSGAYKDNAVARVNYYAPDYAPAGPEPSVPPAGIADRAAVGPETGAPTSGISAMRPPVSAERRDEAATAAVAPEDTSAEFADSGADERTEPSALERAYLLKLTEGAALRSAVTAEKPPSEKAALKKAAAAKDIPRAGAATAARIRSVSFYEQTAAQITRLFSENPRHAELEKLLPDTKWARVDFDGKNYYAVGVVGARPDYVGYAVPARFTSRPPEELDGYAVWVPMDPALPEGDGFWVMYQDAATGESVKREPFAG